MLASNPPGRPNSGGRHRLRSLLEMLSFDASGFAAFMVYLHSAEHTLIDAPQGEPLSDEDRTHVDEAVRGLVKSVPNMPVLPISVFGQIERLKQTADGGLDGMIDRHRAIILLQEVRNNVLDELRAHRYLVVDQERVPLYEQSGPLFGPAVASRFGDAGKDIAAAGQCLALEMWTAAVFHLMQVLEHGLRDLAQRVGATFPISIELESWGRIIDEIDRKIVALGHAQKTAQKPADTEFYSKAASQFWHFKDAWRNHVAHGRDTSDEAQATQVFNAVKYLMQHLTTRP
jgi:hypothetical protein